MFHTAYTADDHLFPLLVEMSTRLTSLGVLNTSQSIFMFMLEMGLQNININSLEVLIDELQKDHKNRCQAPNMGHCVAIANPDVLSHMLLAMRVTNLSCLNYEMIDQYHILMQMYPTDLELMDYQRQLVRLHQEPMPFDDVSPPRVPFTNALPIDTLETDAGNCPICMEPMSPGQRCYRLPCRHLVHTGDDCAGVDVVEWFTRSPTCPICRTSITADVGEKISHMD